MKPNVSFRLATAFSLLLSSSMLLSSHSLFAHSAADAKAGGLRELMAQSAAVAYGKVVDIEYRNSEPTKEEPQGVPHTFVTYEIAKVFRGYLPEKITLRIPGGANGNGGAYSVTSAPTFARGEADVLFIPGGEAGDCQLVNCVEGRFRVVEDRIYSGFGVPLFAAEKTLEFGGKPHFELNTMELPRPSFDNVIKQTEIVRWLEANKVDANGLADLRKKYDLESPPFYHIAMRADGPSKVDDYSGDPEASVMNLYPAPMITNDFFALIERFNVELGQSDQKVIFSNPKLAFTIKPPVVTVMKETATISPRPSSEEINFQNQPEDSVRANTSATSALKINSLTVK